MKVIFSLVVGLFLLVTVFIAVALVLHVQYRGNASDSQLALGGLFYLLLGLCIVSATSFLPFSQVREVGLKKHCARWVLMVAPTGIGLILGMMSGLLPLFLFGLWISFSLIADHRFRLLSK